MRNAMRETRSIPALRALCAAAALCLSALPARAQVEPFAPDFGRTLSLGGRHAAVADSFAALASNPACLVAVPREVSLGRLDLRASGPLFDIASALLDGGDLATAFVDLLADNDYKLYTGADVAGPIAFGYVGSGLGFGLFNRTRVSVNAASATSIGIEAGEDLLLAGGYAFRIALGGGHALDLGISAKGFARGEIAETLGVIDLVGTLEDPMALLDLPFTLTTGVGVDAGLRWNWDEVLAAALVCRDAYSPALVTTYDDATAFIEDPSAAHPTSTAVTLDPDLAFGLAFSPRLGRLGIVLDSILVALDYRDILDLFSPLPRNPILNVGLGVEVRALDILSFRVGVAETLLTTGLGLDFGAFGFDVSAFGSELGIEPGQRPVYNLRVGFDFSL